MASEAYPRELLLIKYLLVRRQYHHCINACSEILRSTNPDRHHPLSKTFATFYLALAHDELARSMHEYSALKITALSNAEKFYREAEVALPTLEQCRVMQRELTRVSDAVTSPPQQTQSSPSPSASSGTESSGTELASPPMRSESEPSVERDDGESDLDSHDSFDNIMTPNRILTRDVSRMSLLDQPLQRDYSSMSLLNVHPKLHKSVSHGLLRPIRPGSPPKQYQLPPNLPFIGQNHTHSNLLKAPSPLPRNTSVSMLPSLAEPHDKPATPQTPPHHPSSGSKNMDVSPLDEEDPDVSLTTVSPVSPRLPVVEVQQATPTQDTFSNSVRLEVFPPSLDSSCIAEHLHGLHAQIQTHLSLLQRAKLTTMVAQAEHTSRLTRSTNSNANLSSDLLAPLANGNVSNRPRSFWSFTPTDAQQAQKKKRIEEGRARGWKKERYRSEKYVALAERTIAEL